MLGIDPAAGIRPIQIGAGVGRFGNHLKEICVQCISNGVRHSLGVAAGGEVGHQNLAIPGRSGRRRGLAHIVVECGNNLSTGSVVSGGKASIAAGGNDTVGAGPVHRRLRIGGNSVFIRVIPGGSSGGTGPAPEDRGYLLACDRIAHAKLPIRVSGNQASSLRPTERIDVVSACLRVREAGCAGCGGRPCGAVEDGCQLCAGHIVVHTKAAISIAVDIAVVGGPLNSFGVVGPCGYIGKFCGIGRDA